ncbi:MAG: flagellar basal body rod C-terminal domain-containing protein, partial [Bryobacteraceae bacterium]
GKSGQLETQEGYAVEDDRGQPIQLDPSQSVEISPDGGVRQQGQEIARIGIVDFSKSGDLAKRDGTYFQVDSKNPAASPASDTQIKQGTLENSNVPAAEAAVRLVGVLRQFEMLQRAVTLGTQMDRSIQDIAKVSS